MLRSWQPPCEDQGDEGGLAGLGCLGSFSDLLGDLSALSSYEDALAEAVYEELDYLLTQKEGLGSPGECLCLPSWDLWLSPPTGCAHLLSICRPHVCPRLTETAPPKRQDGLSEPRDLPASVYTAKARLVPSQP